MVLVASARRSRRRAIQGAAAVILLLAAVGLWLRGGELFGRQYEYEEDLTLSLDGTARLTVNASIPALVALRGLDLDPLSATVDRDRLHAAYSCEVARVASVPRPWTRRGRTFVQVNLEIQDIRRLHECGPFAWSRYRLEERDGHTIFTQAIEGSEFRPGTLQNVGWRGGEIVGFRLHLPARILEHNARSLENDEPAAIARGNILAWEQYLTDRLDGRPIRIVVRTESRSILFLTLWLFAGAFSAAVLALAGVIWWVVRRGKERSPAR